MLAPGGDFALGHDGVDFRGDPPAGDVDPETLPATRNLQPDTESLKPYSIVRTAQAPETLNPT